MKVCSSLATTCWTNTKRQNWNLNQSKYCCPPSFVPLFGQPVRSNGSSRRSTPHPNFAIFFHRTTATVMRQKNKYPSCSTRLLVLRYWLLPKCPTQQSFLPGSEFGVATRSARTPQKC